MSWKEFIVYTSNEAEEAVANVLNEHGANGVVIENIQDIERAKTRQQYGEIYEVQTDNFPKEGIKIKAYFHENDQWHAKKGKLEAAVKRLDVHDIPLGPLRFDTHTVEEADWENEWKKHFHVEQVTDRFTIVPSWEKHEGDKEALLIHIDPGMAFGTGTHPTTILSLQALEKRVKKGDQILDVGVGSGILSIGACLLGASRVFGYDLDPVAVKSTQMNRNLNDLQTQITVAEQDLLKDNTIRADLIVSNILAEILVELVEDAYDALYDNGYFITSGIIQDKQALVEEKLIATGFKVVEKAEMEQWISITAQKKEM